MNRQRLILGIAGPAILAIAIIVLGLSLKLASTILQIVIEE